MSISFEQDRMFAAETIVLEDRQLIVRYEAIGMKNELVVWLRDIDPQIRIVRKRFLRFYISAAISAALIIGCMRYIMGEYSDIELLSDILIVVIAFVTSLQYFRPFDIHQIRGKNGSLVVQLYASKRKRFKCADFIRAFNDLMSSKYTPNKALPPTPTSDTSLTLGKPQTAFMTPEPQVPSPIPQIAPTKAEVAHSPPRVQKSANWFWWIAGLSVINSISAHAEGGMHFVVGLGFTELVDGFFHSIQPIAYFIDLLAVGFFVGIGYFARKGHLWAFIVGGVFYTLDAVIYAYFHDWLPVGFHAYALFWIYQGFAQLRVLHAVGETRSTV